jgi:hypothetical protein
MAKMSPAQAKAFITQKIYDAVMPKHPGKSDMEAYKAEYDRLTSCPGRPNDGVDLAGIKDLVKLAGIDRLEGVGYGFFTKDLSSDEVAEEILSSLDENGNSVVDWNEFEKAVPKS